MYNAYILREGEMFFEDLYHFVEILEEKKSKGKKKSKNETKRKGKENKENKIKERKRKERNGT